MARLVEDSLATQGNKQTSATLNVQKAFTELPLLERDKELNKLLQHAIQTKPFLVCGVPGSGKTRLLAEAEERLTDAGKKVLYVPFAQPPHRFLASVAVRLGLRSDTQSSAVLRGLLWKKLEREPHILLIDGISEASTSFYRFFERVLCCPSFTLIGSALNPHVLGSLHRVFWNQQAIVSLRLLSKPAASSLADAAIHLFVPDLPAAANFRDHVVRAARGNPGRIVGMCIRAADPAYRNGDRVRFAALNIDSFARLRS
jgi:AAA domain (dynein-related subfamily)